MFRSATASRVFAFFASPSVAIPPSSSQYILRLRSTHQILRLRSNLAQNHASTRSTSRFRLQHRLYSSKPPQTPKPHPTVEVPSPEPALSLSQRMRKLSREYGYSALGVYIGLLVLDFPFCYLAVQYMGAERIGRYEHVIMERLKDIVRVPFPDAFDKGDEKMESDVAKEVEEEETAEEQGGATVWTKLALAFVIHKSFIFVRVPLTAALTPKVVKTLRGWGWNIGKRKPKAT